MRLIDFDALGVGKCNPEVFDDKGYANGWNNAIEILQNAPTVDAVPVCRCRDCKHRPTKPGKYADGFDIAFPYEVCPCYCDDDPFYSGYPEDDWFCPNGERKGGDEDDLQSVGLS